MFAFLNPFKQNLQENEKRFAGILILASLFFHIIAAIFSIGFHHYDEHFQILEFAALKLGLTSEKFLPWEFPAQIRPALQPAIAWFFIKFAGFKDTFAAATFLRFLSAILGWFALWFFSLYAIKYIKLWQLRKFFLLLTALLWFIPYIHARFSSESWSMAFFFLGLTVFLKILDRKTLKLSTKQAIAITFAGLFFGLSYVFRFQGALLVPGLFLWALFIQKSKLQPLFYTTFGVLVAIFLGLLADYWFYGEWVNSAYNYYHQNIVNDVASKFGTEPWWWYFTQTAMSGQFLIGWLIVISSLFVFIKYPKNPVNWAVLPFLILHCIIAHKELRFLFPLANFIPLWIALFFDRNLLNQLLSNRKTLKVLKVIVVLFFVYNVAIMMVISTNPAKATIAPIQFIYKNYGKSGATVAYVRENIFYSMAELHVNFYQPNTIDTARAKDTAMLALIVDTASKPVLFWGIGHNVPQEIKTAGLQAEEIYSTLPEWLLRFNFNNWVKRTPVQKIYLLHKKD